MHKSLGRVLAKSMLWLGAVTLAGCSSGTVGKGGACGVGASQLDALDANGRPHWVSEIFETCAVGSADWSSSGGKEQGETSARSAALSQLARSVGKQKVRVVEVGSVGTAFVQQQANQQVTQQGSSQVAMTAESEEVTIRVRVVRRFEDLYMIYVLVERQP